jgi:hypothetical protein
MKTKEEEFVEKGAELEHDRWARWQKYMFSKAQVVIGNDNEEIGIFIPIEYWKHWQKEIDTPYSELTEEQKESDRKETRNYLTLISKIRQDDIDGLVEFFAGYEKPAEDDYDGGYSHALSDIIAHLKALKEKV